VLVIFWHTRSHCSRLAGEQRSDGPKEEFCVKAIVGAGDDCAPAHLAKTKMPTAAMAIHFRMRLVLMSSSTA
jgi:hypothetical protein